jgi:tetratricopeptide (TPR) repeat protein
MNNLQTAIKDLKQSIEQDPNLDRAYFNLGDIYLKQKNYKVALDYFTKDRELRPNNPDTLFKNCRNLP